MAERLFDAQKMFDSFNPEDKCKQKLKRCMTKLSHCDTHDSVIKQILTPTQKSIKCSKKQPFNSSILPPKCAVYSQLLLTTKIDVNILRT